jgi:NADH:ubiquinone oxidoreductase subunit F (NADH-binding)
MFGLPALADVFRRLAGARPSRADLKALGRYAAEIDGRGACHHPDGAVRLARTALRCFADDVRRHAKSGPCPGASAARVLPVPEVT